MLVLTRKEEESIMIGDDIEVKVLDLKESQVKLGIEMIEIPVRIGWALIEEVPLLLGRLDVFGHFAVEFREFEDKIFLKPQREV